MNHEIFCQNSELTGSFLTNPKSVQKGARTHSLSTTPTARGGVGCPLVPWGLTPTLPSSCSALLITKNRDSSESAQEVKVCCKNVRTKEEKGMSARKLAFPTAQEQRTEQAPWGSQNGETH